MALPLGTLVDDIEIRRVISVSDWALVYEGYDRSLDQAVALKEYLPSFSAFRAGIGATAVSAWSDRLSGRYLAGLQCFIEEAELLAQFDHPSIAKLHRSFEANGTAYSVMSLYDESNLEDAFCDTKRNPGEAWLMRLLAQILGALAALHAKGCCHLNITPDNILLQKDGTPVLVGFAPRRCTRGLDADLPTQGHRLESLPIEQFGEGSARTLGPWTDIFSLAAVVYYAIVGRAYLPSAALQPPLSRMVEGQYSARLLGAIDRALGLSQEARPRSVPEFASLLGLSAPIPDSIKTLAAVPRRVDGSSMAPARPVWLWLSVGVASLAIGVALVLRTQFGVQNEQIVKVRSDQKLHAADPAHPRTPSPSAANPSAMGAGSAAAPTTVIHHSLVTEACASDNPACAEPVNKTPKAAASVRSAAVGKARPPDFARAGSAIVPSALSAWCAETLHRISMGERISDEDEYTRRRKC